MYAQAGVDSNFVVDEGRVMFVQADDSLTVLRLDDGKVMARKHDIEYSGTLQMTAEGVLVLKYSGASLLDPTNLTLKWNCNAAYNSIVSGDVLVTCDGNGLIECRNLSKGRVLWSYELPGALNIAVDSGKVLLLRSAVYERPDREPTVVLLELKTGRELFRRTAPQGVSYIAGYLDDESVYVATGTYTGQYDPKSRSRFDRGRASARFENLLIWNLAGQQVESVPAPDALKKNSREDAFSMSGKTFAQGHVWEGPDKIPPRRPGEGRMRQVSKDKQGVMNFVTEFVVDGGLVTVFDPERSSGDVNSRGERCRIEFKSASGSWRGSLPYLGDRGREVAVAATGKYLLFGSDLGHVECVEKESGRHRWIYQFPTMRHTLSYSSPNGMPPYVATAAKIYRLENKRKAESGLVLDGGSPPKPNIILDPSPANPFRDLPFYLTIAWSGGVLPILTIGMVAWSRKKRGFSVRISAIIGILLSIVAVVCYMELGRVSVGSSLVMRLGISVPWLVAGCFTLNTFKEKHWVSGVSFGICLVAIAVFIFPVFVRL